MLLEINPNILVRDEERMPNRPSIREGSTAVVLMVTHRETTSCVTKICKVSRKTSQELRIAALRVVGCQGVKVFLLKDVIITTSVTNVILLLSQFTTVTVTTFTRKMFSHKKILVTNFF